MKLIDFKDSQAMDRLREKMGASYAEWDAWDWEPTDSDRIRGRLASQYGIELSEDLSGLEIEDDGTFSYKGERVLLYIRDQYYSSRYPDQEYKYHICSCQTIQKMFESNRKNRYVVTNNTSGEFEVHITNRSTGKVRHEGTKEMRVCKSCLNQLRYKGYGRHGSPKAKRIYANFDLEEFFEIHGQTQFEETPDYTAEDAPRNAYTDDFGEVSKRYRRQQHWTCEECGVNLSDDRQWLHTHHRNHQKNDNHPKNLKALCVECHSNIHPEMDLRSELRRFRRRYR